MTQSYVDIPLEMCLAAFVMYILSTVSPERNMRLFTFITRV